MNRGVDGRHVGSATEEGDRTGERLELLGRPFVCLADPDEASPRRNLLSGDGEFAHSLLDDETSYAANDDLIGRHVQLAQRVAGLRPRIESGSDRPHCQRPRFDSANRPVQRVAIARVLVQLRVREEGGETFERA